jgi:hypothetical protein
VQFGFGRVSTTHAPWSQYLPAPHSPSPAHVFVHEPPTHLGASTGHAVSAVQPPPTGVGLQTPLSHVKPSEHGAAAQLERHWPSAQTLSSPHSLENLQPFSCAVHEPPTHAWPASQSVAAVSAEHGHGPALPPHAWHALSTHTLPSPQSLLVVHSFFVPGSLLGAAQSPLLQTSPFGQLVSDVQTVAQPVEVHCEPGAQLALPVHAWWSGVETPEHP